MREKVEKNFDFRNVLYGFNVESGKRTETGNKNFEKGIENCSDLEVFYEDDFIVHLTIDGTDYDDVEVRVTNPNKTIREQIDSIIDVFELQKFCPDGTTPRQFLLEVMENDYDEPVVLDFADEDGKELSILDYNITPGAHLHLIEPPLYGCPFDINENNSQKSIPFYKKWFQVWKKYSC